MPWHIGTDSSCPSSRPFAVIKDGTDTVEGCHPTEEAAARQLAALYASEPQARAAKATILDDDSFRLLAIPFGGPIPSPHSPRGVDLDGEWFSERTDIRPEWLKARAVDWHHGADSTFGREVIGKAVDPVMDEDGWWVTVWLDHGKRRIELIKRLAERGAQIFGSSESVAGLVSKAATGEILSWPYWRQTLSTSPQNTRSVIRPVKAVGLQDPSLSTTAFWHDVSRELSALASDLRSPWGHAPGKSAATDPAMDLAVRQYLAALDKALEVARRSTSDYDRREPGQE